MRLKNQGIVHAEDITSIPLTGGEKMAKRALKLLLKNTIADCHLHCGRGMNSQF